MGFILMMRSKANLLRMFTIYLLKYNLRGYLCRRSRYSNVSGRLNSNNQWKETPLRNFITLDIFCSLDDRILFCFTRY